MPVWKNLPLLLTIFCLSVCACAPQGSALPVTTATPSHSPQPSPALIVTPTATHLPDTPTPYATGTTTPLPTMPTFMPTFDARMLATATYAPKAACPRENKALVLELGLAATRACLKRAFAANGDPRQCTKNDLQQSIQDYLNQGGRIESIVSQLKADGQQEGGSYIFRDLTGDTVPDLVFRDRNSMFGGFYIYTCANGNYNVQTIFDGDPNEFMIGLAAVKDLNGDGLPEIVLISEGVLYVFEWNGNTFDQITEIEEYGDEHPELLAPLGSDYHGTQSHVYVPADVCPFR